MALINRDVEHAFRPRCSIWFRLPRPAGSHTGFGDIQTDLTSLELCAVRSRDGKASGRSPPSCPAQVADLATSPTPLEVLSPVRGLFQLARPTAADRHSSARLQVSPYGEACQPSLCLWRLAHVD